MEGRGDPAILIDRAVAAGFEILDVAGRGRRRVIERIEHAHARDRLLGDAIDLGRRLDAHGFVDRRNDVDHVVELRAQAALLLDARRPGHDQAVARAAEMRRHALHPLERREPAQDQPTG